MRFTAKRCCGRQVTETKGDRVEHIRFIMKELYREDVKRMFVKNKTDKVALLMLFY